MCVLYNTIVVVWSSFYYVTVYVVMVTVNRYLVIRLEHCVLLPCLPVLVLFCCVFALDCAERCHSFFVAMYGGRGIGDTACHLSPYLDYKDLWLERW